MTDLDSLRTALTNEAPLTWVLAGDSITHGMMHTHAARSYPEHLHEAVRGDLLRFGDVMITTAISGWRLHQILEDWPRRVADWRPDVVTLMIGTNDCSVGPDLKTITPETFEQQLHNVVARVRDIGALLILQTPPEVDIEARPDRSRFIEFVDVLRRVATDSGSGLVDHHAEFRARAQCLSLDYARPLLSDAFHPNAAGHALMAHRFLSDLGLDPERCPTLGRLEAIVGAATQ